MGRRIRSGFEVEVFDDRIPSPRRLEQFLSVYVRHFSPRHRTDTNQLIHYMRQPLPGRRIIYFGLCFESEPCGFCALMFYPEQKIGVFDFIVIAPQRRGHGAFFAFADLISQYLEQVDLAFDYLAAEVLLDDGPVAYGLTPTRIIQLLRWQRFRRAKIRYTAPDPTMVEDLKSCRAVLMLAAEPDRTSIAASELIRIIELIYLDHYLLWFKGVMTESQAAAYEAAIRGECHRISSAARAAETIHLNGVKDLEPYLQVTPDRRAFAALVATAAAGVVTVAVGLRQEPVVAGIIVTSALGLFAGAMLSRKFRRYAGRLFGLSI